MAKRFREHGEAYFRFITTPRIDPTNNAAERAIRFIVIARVVTQGTRSIQGRTASERLWTIIATCRLQGQSAFDFILQAVHARFHDLPPPSSCLPSSQIHLDFHILLTIKVVADDHKETIIPFYTVNGYT